MRISPFALVKRFAREERGASFVEYALLIALVVTAIAGIGTALFTNVGTALNNAATNISNTASGVPTTPGDLADDGS